jgi:hypothetical protein
MTISKQQQADAVYNMITRQPRQPRQPRQLNKSKSPPMIDLKNILNGKIKITEDNPKFRLSIEDYTKMCNNKILRGMIAKALNIEMESLTAFCKDIKVLDRYIDLSQSTIKEKKIAKALPIKILLTHLPSDSIKMITDYYQTILKYKLIEWFPINKLQKDFVSANPNAIEFLSLPENKEFINWHVLSSNPNAIDFLSLPENKEFINYNYLSCNKSSNPKLIELLKEYIKKTTRWGKINWEELSKNPYAVELFTLPENRYYINWKGLSSNPSPKAIKFLTLDENIEMIKWFEFSSNPCDAAIKFLIDNPHYIDWSGLSANSNIKVIPLITKRINEEKIIEETSPKEYANLKNKVYWRALSANPNAIDLIITKIKEGIRLNEIDWWALSKNPSIFIPFKNNVQAKSKAVARILSRNLPSNSQTRITDLPSDLHKKILVDLVDLSKNELREGIPVEKLNWSWLSENPNAIDFFRERLYFEKNLSELEYDKLPYKINWGNLCRNPKAIELLSMPENYEKIDWQNLSKNPKAIYLLEDRVKYQIKIQQEGRLNSLMLHKKIDWNELSANPAIFVPK